ncbi:hypothetical protein AGRA3207_002421 [Actinomadura graeca]|uniref:Uncharacterized protein n=1 Tax=Actinomadura graeca TaxID=2750812 RepID=A0ABX8RB93_9ACTN|nr:hypothetical protein [Actinomadura graeca]QXJ27042.1 hypothetical protein AGRA3207_002421 [Actinomadura graeca]
MSAPIPPDAPFTPLALTSGHQAPTRFPGRVRHWRGEATGRYWALVPWPWNDVGYRLVEGVTLDDLAEQVEQLLESIAARGGGVPGAGGGAAAAAPPLPTGHGARAVAACSPGPSRGARPGHHPQAPVPAPRGAAPVTAGGTGARL